jgi:UDP-N-acetylmuramate dehydrogenase
VFKKIEGVGAGRLIDQAGLKGFQIGGVQISPKHANFLVNIDGGTARNVLDLVRHTQDAVKETSGYELEMEIGLVGEF